MLLTCGLMIQIIYPREEIETGDKCKAYPRPLKVKSATAFVISNWIVLSIV
jgi:hypothetical protein